MEVCHNIRKRMNNGLGISRSLTTRYCLTPGQHMQLPLVAVSDSLSTNNFVNY